MVAGRTRTGVAHQVGCPLAVDAHNIGLAERKYGGILCKPFDQFSKRGFRQIQNLTRDIIFLIIAVIASHSSCGKMG